MVERRRNSKGCMKTIAVLALMLAGVIPAHAQTRVLVGAEGGSSFGNLFLAPSVKLEIPVSRTEFDFEDSFSPFEQHLALGSGWANAASGEAIIWIREIDRSPTRRRTKSVSHEYLEDGRVREHRTRLEESRRRDPDAVVFRLRPRV